ncbi:hypothetical protein [Algoriphagus aquimarinus]|uniref:Uncharacterized protein n=1 Tax=Algoriphagus aquimarinus TaxID=237018 RepID=A0A5C7AH87_9BACT|nr:hypothetical protein [Algoriphagus aquimarinus]TXE04035.1 hypothetical protein ESV85_19290 [Algoriphagus aquimarinus]
MRQLSEKEVDQVKKAIAYKDLTSAEILVEIYDHYVSHLETFEEADFKDELFELEQKFRYSYYNPLQENFEKTAKKELRKIQWSICKSYLSWPKIIFTALVVIILTLIFDNLEGKTKGLAVIYPMGVAVLLFGLIALKSYLKVRKIKKNIGIASKVQSSFLTNLSLQFQMILGFFNLFVLIPKIFFDNPIWFESTYFIMASFLFSLFYIGYLFSLIEAWKVKSKTALI